MKKSVKVLSLVLILLMILSLAGCGASASKSATYDMAPAEAPAASMERAEAEDMMLGSGLANTTAGSGEGVQPGNINTEKIIYSAEACVETTEYETTIEDIYALVEELGGFMESTSLSGANYYQAARGNTGNRWAHFTIRIPSENFNTLTTSLSTLGNVPYCNTYSENITRTYYDVQSRLTAYKTQETRLLEMLAIAETVEDMLAIQQQLTEVQYEIDSLTSTLSNYDNEVRYSTVNLSVEEVQEYTPEPIVTMSYWEKMTTGFVRSLKSVGSFFTDLLLWLVTNLPVLILIAALACAAVVVIRRWIHRIPQREAIRAARAERKAQKAAEKAARKAQKQQNSKQ